MSDTAAQLRARKFAIATLIVASLGAALSLYLAYHHNMATNQAGYTSFCSINQTIDCDAVNASKQSEIVIPLTEGGIRIPVAQLSLIFYIGLAWMAWIRFRVGHRDGLAPISYAFFLSLFGALFSLGMAYVSFFVLKKLCIFCTGLYVTGLAFPILARLSAHAGYDQMVDAVTQDLRGNAFQRAGVVAVGALIVFLGAKMPYWMGAADGKSNSLSQIAEDWKNAPKALVGSGSAYRKGNSDAPVTVVEFADFQCPACRHEASEIRKVMKKYPGTIQIYFRHLPLDPSCNPNMKSSLHPFACTSAKAAECAGDQGRFWDYHDRLFAPVTEPKPDLTNDGLIAHAEALGLDMDSFNDCFENDRSVEAKITEDISEAVFAGASSTPTLIINNKKMSRALTLAQWEEILRIEGFIEKAGEPADSAETASSEETLHDHTGHDHP